MRAPAFIRLPVIRRRSAVSGFALALFAPCLLVSSALAIAGTGETMRGVNLAGGEFGHEKLPGKAFSDYIYPDEGVAAPFLKSGMTTARVPVLWERIQPEPFKPLSDTEMAGVDMSLHALSGFRTIILDVHNYGRYRDVTLDRMPNGSAALADLWKRLAERYKDDGRIAFGIMNEPHGIDAHVWRKMVDQSVKAIRDAGARNLLLVPGTNWTGAHSWMSGGPASNAEAFRDFSDPGGNFVFELHQYLDADSSGTTDQCVDAKAGSRNLAQATQWLRGRRARGLLGEFGGSASPVCLAALEDMLTFMDKNPDVWAGWTYWAGGPWWGDYALSIQPKDGKARPQMEVLQRHLGK